MVADQMEKGIIPNKIPGAKKSMAVAVGFVLNDKLDLYRGIFQGGLIRIAVRGRNDQSDMVYSRAKDFVKNNPDSCFLHTIRIDQNLQRKPVLMTASGCNDGFFDVHLKIQAKSATGF